MLTPEQLQSIMPGLKPQRNREYLPFLETAMAEFAIQTAARMAAFLAQLAHESGQLRYMEEIWGPTAAQGRYEPPSKLATTLGNIDSGDGFRFKGRGPIQITGRSNYHRFGDLLGIDLVADPERAALPEVAFRIAALFWSKKGLNELADNGTADAFREITRRINGGFNGLPEREKFYMTARTVLAVEIVPATRGMRSPSPSRQVEDYEFSRGAEAIRSVVEDELEDEAAVINMDQPERRRVAEKSRPAKPKRRAKAGARAGDRPGRKTMANTKAKSKRATAISNRRKASKTTKASSTAAPRTATKSKSKRRTASTSPRRKR